MWSAGISRTSSRNTWSRCRSWMQGILPGVEARLGGLRFHACVPRAGTIDRTRRCVSLENSEGIWPRAEATVFCPSALYAGFLTRSCANLVTNLNQSQAGRAWTGKIKTRLENMSRKLTRQPITGEIPSEAGLTKFRVMSSRARCLSHENIITSHTILIFPELNFMVCCYLQTPRCSISRYVMDYKVVSKLRELIAFSKIVIGYFRLNWFSVRVSRFFSWWLRIKSSFICNTPLTCLVSLVCLTHCAPFTTKQLK